MKTKDKIAEIEREHKLPIGQIIKRLNNDGQGVSLIAEVLKTNTMLIYRAAAEAGIELKPTPRSQFARRSDALAFEARINDEYDGQTPSEVIAGYTNDGYGPEVIAGFIGCCRKKVVLIAKEHGIALNKRTAKHLQPHHEPTAAARAAAAAACRKYDFDVEAAAKKIGITKKHMYRRLKNMPKDMALSGARRNNRRNSNTLRHPWRESYDRLEHDKSFQQRAEG